MPINVRPTAVAGTWYPGEPSVLQERVGELLCNAASHPISGRIWSVIVPHAGYVYSGPVAARAFALLPAQPFDVVAVLTPYHAYHPASMLTSAHEAYQTPLGTVPIQREQLAALSARIRAEYGWGLTPITADREHSVEAQLPFLQHVIGGFQLLPIMLRTQESRVLKRLGQLLAEILSGEAALLVASSDLSHNYPQDLAAKLDAEILRRLVAFDPDGVLSAEREGVGYACGAGAMATALWAARALGADTVSLADYATSGDVNGEFEHVVGYGSAIVWEQGESIRV